LFLAPNFLVLGIDPISEILEGPFPFGVPDIVHFPPFFFVVFLLAVAFLSSRAPRIEHRVTFPSPHFPLPTPKCFHILRPPCLFREGQGTVLPSPGFPSTPLISHVSDRRTFLLRLSFFSFYVFINPFIFEILGPSPHLCPK